MGFDGILSACLVYASLTRVTTVEDFAKMKFNWWELPKNEELYKKYSLGHLMST